MTIAVKACSRCGTTKPLSEYRRRKRARDGFDAACRECLSAANRAYYERNKDKWAERWREKKQDPVARERKRDRDKRYYEANRERHAEQSREWAARNRERRREIARESARRINGYQGRKPYTLEEKRQARRDAQRRHDQKPEVREARCRREQERRARKRGARCEEVVPLVVLERDDGVCGICGGDVDPLDFHVDHVVPLALGGPHTYSNVQVAHPSCNVKKGASRHR